MVLSHALEFRPARLQQRMGQQHSPRAGTLECPMNQDAGGAQPRGGQSDLRVASPIFSEDLRVSELGVPTSVRELGRAGCGVGASIQKGGRRCEPTASRRLTPVAPTPASSSGTRAWWASCRAPLQRPLARGCASRSAPAPAGDACARPRRGWRRVAWLPAPGSTADRATPAAWTRARRIMARSITLRSSRTLPGHECACSADIESASRPDRLRHGLANSRTNAQRASGCPRAARAAAAARSGTTFSR